MNQVTNSPCTCSSHMYLETFVCLCTSKLILSSSLMDSAIQFHFHWGRFRLLRRSGSPDLIGSKCALRLRQIWQRRRQSSMRILTVGCIAATAASYASFAPTTAPRVGAPMHTAPPDCRFRAVRQPRLHARRRRCAEVAHLTCIVVSRSYRSREVTQRDGPVRAAGARDEPCAAAAAAVTVSWVHAPAALPQHRSCAANTVPGPCPSARIN
jgi:hypothetical protein